MKPCLRLLLNVWDCRLPDWRHTEIIGYGFCPKSAYNDWIAQGGRA